MPFLTLSSGQLLSVRAETSLAVSTYSITPSASSMNEGASLTFNVTTTNVTDATILYWTILDTTTNSADFSATSGSFSISTNTGSFSVTTTNDATTEGSQTFRVQLRTDSTSGTVVATSSTVTIADSSLTPTYSVSPSASSVQEGSTITFNVTTTNVPNGTTLYWTNSGSSNATDFSGSVNSGSLTISSNSGSVVMTTNSDETTEGTETIIFQLRTDSTGGTIVATSSTVNLTEPLPTLFTVSPAASSATEGDSVTFNVTSQNVANGTTVYWTRGSPQYLSSLPNETTGLLRKSLGRADGDYSTTPNGAFWFIGIDANYGLDWMDNGAGGATSIVSDVVTSAINLSAATNATQFQSSHQFLGYFKPTTTETYTFYLTHNDVGGVWVGHYAVAGGTMPWNSTSSDATAGRGGYNSTAESSGTVDLVAGRYYPIRVIQSKNESGGAECSLSFSTPSISKTSDFSGKIFYYPNALGLARNLSDAEMSAASGSFTINSNAGSFTATTTTDTSTEGDEILAVQIRTGSTSGTLKAVGQGVRILDKATYSVSPSSTSVNEGTTVTWTITTSAVPDGTILYWTDGGTAASGDWSDSATSGSFTVSSNTASVSRTLVNDLATEGSETSILQIRTTSTSGTIVAQSATVAINDTSTAPSYTVTPAVSSVNEGSSVTFNVSTTNVANGTTLYRTVVGGDASDFSSTSGSFTISSNAGSFSVTTLQDSTTEGNETFYVEIRTGSTSGTIVATSSNVTINDTSTASNPVIGYSTAGGYFTGLISYNANGVATHQIILAPKASGEQGGQFRTALAANSPVGGYIDGYTDTDALNNATYPRCQWARSLNINGYTDWYIPSKFESEIVFYNTRGATGSNNYTATADPQGVTHGVNSYAVPQRNSAWTASVPGQTTWAAARTGGTEVFADQYHWTSSQNSANTSQQLLRYWGTAIATNNGRITGQSKIVTSYRVRAIRRQPL